MTFIFITLLKIWYLYLLRYREYVCRKNDILSFSGICPLLTLRNTEPRPKQVVFLGLLALMLSPSPDEPLVNSAKYLPDSGPYRYNKYFTQYFFIGGRYISKYTYHYLFLFSYNLNFHLYSIFYNIVLFFETLGSPSP